MSMTAVDFVGGLAMVAGGPVVGYGACMVT